MGERTVYRNLWYGLTLEHPAGWLVRQAPGCVVIGPDAASMTCAAVRFFAVDPGLSLRQVAEQVVGLIRRADPGVRAWTEQPEDGITVHLSATVNGTPVRGWTLLQARGGSVMATGLQAPAGELAGRAPVLGEILASLRFEDPPPLRRFDDSAEHAFGGYAPEDWSVQAYVQRTPTQERIPLLVLSAADPSGELSLQVPLSYEQYSERPVFGGSRLLRFVPYPGVAAYLRHIAAGPLSRERPGVRVGEVVAEPEFAALERAQSAPGIPSQVESASIVLAYDQGGVAYREAVTATLVRLVSAGSWTARIAARRRAPAHRYSEADTIFCGIMQSIAPDPEWVRNEQARASQVLGQAMGRNAQAQSDLANAVRHLGQVRRDGAAGLAAGARHHMDAFFREQELHVMPTLRGDQIMVNPVDGRRYEVPLSYGTYWSDAVQRVYRTTDPNAPPVIGANRLEPI